MKVCIEVPTNERQDLDYLTSIAGDDCFCFSVCLNGTEFKPKDELRRHSIIAVKPKSYIQDPCVSMSELRSLAHDYGADEFKPDYSIIADGNFIYNEGWQEFILSCISDMELFSQSTGEKAIFAMSGYLGSKAWQGRTQIPICPMIETDKGIIYPSADNPWGQVKHLPSGFEDYMITSHMVVAMRMVPLKRFLSPVRHPRRTKAEYEQSLIHDRRIWGQHNLKIVQALWNDPNWSLPTKHKDLARKCIPKNEEYRYKQPRKSFAFMCRLRNRFFDHPIAGKFVTRSYEDDKWQREEQTRIRREQGKRGA